MGLSRIPDTHRDLLKDETRAFAYLATVMEDGSPQVTPIWFNTDAEHILINSAQGRVKDKNMKSRPEVALVIQDPKNAYRYLQVRGKVTEITTEVARDHIDTLAMKYRGTSKYISERQGEVRVTYKISVTGSSSMG
jgi:PPOX class probable F420-dependent enzyme